MIYQGGPLATVRLLHPDPATRDTHAHRRGKGGEMTDITREPKLVLPFLRRFYEFVIPLSWPIVRIACGMHLVIHGCGKILRGGTVSGSTLAFGIFLTFIEFFG